MKPQPMIAVSDVPRSSQWYQQLLGGRSGHGGDEYERIIDAAGELVLQLHHWDIDEHPHLGNPGQTSYGNGVLLWYRVEDFDAAVARAAAMEAVILEGPQVNPSANHREVWVRDLDGYVVVLAGPPGDV